MVRPLILVLLTLWSLAAHAEKRIALLIGNEGYNTAGLNPLSSPHGDVDRIAAALRESGFTEVVVLKDQSQIEMRRALQQFRAKLSAGGSNAIGFFYYSGHGAALEQGRTRTSYFIPVGNSVEYAEDLEVYGVDIRSVISLLEETGAGAVFLSLMPVATH